MLEYRHFVLIFFRYMGMYCKKTPSLPMKYKHGCLTSSCQNFVNLCQCPLCRAWQDLHRLQGLAPHIASLIVYPVYIPICYVTAASNGYIFKFPWTLGKQDLSWLVDLPKWWCPQLQQHNRMLAVAQTVLRHSLGISMEEFTSSWQESFTVDKFWSKSFVYSFTKKNVVSNPGKV